MMNIKSTLSHHQLIIYLFVLMTGTLLLEQVTSFLNPSSNSYTVKKIPQQYHLKRYTSFQSQSKSPFFVSNQPPVLKIKNGEKITTQLFSSHTNLMSTMSSIRTMLHADNSYCLSAILLLSTLGIVLEEKTTIGKALSAPLVTMAFALIVSNLTLIPFQSPIYTMINKYLVPLAVPLLLYESNLRVILNSKAQSKSLLQSFCIGAISTILATFVTYPLLPLRKIGDNGYKVASALAARHIGGAINFVAVSETLNIDSSCVNSAIAADNVVVALYFAFLFYLAKSGGMDTIIDDGTNTTKNDKVALEEEGKAKMTMQSLAISLSVASCLVTLGNILTKMILPPGVSALPTISIITVAAATTFPSFFSRISKTGTNAGIIFIQMFLAASGAAGSIRLVLESAPSLFLFSALQLVLHFLFLMGIGKIIFKLPSNMLYLASNANVGGPTTAAAMATAKSWSTLVLPSLLVGILGYSIATPTGLVISQILKKLPLLAR